MKDIPKFLIEMSEQLNTQNNRITAEPIFMVCYDKWLTCANDRGDKEIYLINNNGEYTECDTNLEVAEYMKEHHEDWFLNWMSKEDNPNDFDSFFDNFDADYESYPEGVEVEIIRMQKEMTIVKACLTEADANYFIKRKQHDYAKLYTYVESMNYCPQMIELRNWIKSLTVI